MIRYLNVLGRAGAALLWIGIAVAPGFAAGAADPQPVPDTQNPNQHPPSPAESLAKVTVPEGFRVTLFAGEPDLRQPIAFTFDDRGRLWVVECYSYPNYEILNCDRVLIFEDVDGDGRFDTRKVFFDEGTHLTGIQVGFGGVWLCSAPNLIFIPDANRDDVPDGPPQVLLDGWNFKDMRHNIMNGLRWGPDGWLYGRHGILADSHVGRPGTPDEARARMNCGVWRYHPTRRVFEVVAHGTTNPWGLDFNDYGEAFFTNNVIGHLWHLVPGAHYKRMYGEDYNPHLYELMSQTADHLHWAGEKWQLSRDARGVHGQLGGGHSHAGGMIYLGDNWPDEYRGDMFMCNTHGRRVNRDRLERRGSGYVARHEEDFFFANDPWFRGVALKYGPDGGVYVIDWNDLGECHDHDGVLRGSGRMYKITYGEPKPPGAFDLTKRSNLELVELQLHKNDWYVRHARRILQERAAAGQNMKRAEAALREMLASHEDVTRRLRALWALNAIDALNERDLLAQLDQPNEHQRAWAARLLCDQGTPATAVLEKFARLARNDESGLVRLYLAAMLQRLPLAARAEIAAGLVARGEDADDRNLSLMIWYGIEPLVASDFDQARRLAEQARIPLVRRFIARRVTAASDKAEPVRTWIAQSDDPALQRDLLQGWLATMRGRRNEKMPPGWNELYERFVQSSDAQTRQAMLALAVIYGDQRALEYHRKTMMDQSAAADARRHSLRTLAELRVPDLAPALQKLLADPATRGAAIRALAAYDDPATPAALLRHYRQFALAERRATIGTLAARVEYARKLLAAVERGDLPSTDLSAVHVRQIQGLGDKPLNAKLKELWGTVRQSSAEKKKLIEDYKNLLQPAYVEQADLSHGRLLFARTCAQCHTLFGEGGKIGPDLTGSNRANLHYILENVFDPSAAVARGFQMTSIITADGRVLSGIVGEQNDRTLVVQTPNERLVLDRRDIDAMRPSQQSMMPEGLIAKMTDEEIRDLVGYLAAKSQVPLPPGAKPRETKNDE